MTTGHLHAEVIQDLTELLCRPAVEFTIDIVRMFDMHVSHRPQGFQCTQRILHHISPNGVKLKSGQFTLLATCGHEGFTEQRCPGQAEGRPSDELSARKRHILFLAECTKIM